VPDKNTDDARRDTLIDIFHAESLAHAEANVGRLTRMLGLIAIGFGGLAALASLLWKDSRTEVLFVAPFVILILWMSCVRLLAEMGMASEYQRYNDRHLADLVDTKDHRIRSWQSSAAARGSRSASNLTIYGFLAIVSVVTIGLCSWQGIAISGWIGAGVAVVWAIAVVLIIISAARIPALRRRVRSDLEAQSTP
jgi:hypothetical protein